MVFLLLKVGFLPALEIMPQEFHLLIFLSAILIHQQGRRLVHLMDTKPMVFLEKRTTLTWLLIIMERKL